jgi:hypothetical protein
LGKTNREDSDSTYASRWALEREETMQQAAWEREEGSKSK